MIKSKELLWGKKPINPSQLAVVWNTLPCCPKFWKLVSSAVDLYKLPFGPNETCLQKLRPSHLEITFWRALWKDFQNSFLLCYSQFDAVYFGKTKNNGISLQRKYFSLCNNFRTGKLKVVSLTHAFPFRFYSKDRYLSAFFLGAQHIKFIEC